MTKGRLIVAGTVAAFAATVLLLGGVLRESTAAETAPATPPLRATPAALGGDFAQRGTAELVRRLQSEVRARPNDARSLVLLGLAYQQRVRETGDAGYYAKSEGVLRRAFRLHPKNALATSGLGSLALARHDFREALRLGRRAERLSPGTARNLGVVGDALIELGRYDEAFRAFDRMAALKPSVASYARIAYGRELLGRPRSAIAAMKLAADAAGAQPEPAAWSHHQLGKLYWSIGDAGSAAREYAIALTLFPGYVYALDSLAHVAAARGDRRRAIALAKRAVEAVPLPQFAATLGDLYRSGGQERLAREQYALVGAIERLLVANGVKTDLETALFNVDHGIRLRQSLALARRAHAERPSLDADEVLAWALVRNGRCQEARRYSERALRLGTKDAARFFHRGMIERCLGRPGVAKRWFARALRTNPHFSLIWAPVARMYVS